MVTYEVLVDGRVVPCGDYALFRYAQARAVNEARSGKSVRVDRVSDVWWAWPVRTTLVELGPPTP